MPGVSVRNLDVLYTSRHGVRDINFDLEDGAIGCLLGPSGCGKTTVLRAVAGFVSPVKGEIAIGDRVMFARGRSVPTEQRNIGMVFQDFALFPHLRVNENVSFGLRHWSTKEQAARVQELLELVGMANLARAYPHELSGGEQQRVALARAMAPRPSLLLFDEPFSSLDVEMREQLASDVREILKREASTAILVTHDQNEAFAIADEVCVMHAGAIQQRDIPYNLYHHPANRFVADFIGEGVFVRGVIEADGAVKTAFGELPGTPPGVLNSGDEVDVLIRPDDVIYDPEGFVGAEVVARAFRGSVYLYTLKTELGIKLLSLMPSHHYFEVGDRINVDLDLHHLAAFPAEPVKHARHSTR